MRLVLEVVWWMLCSISTFNNEEKNAPRNANADAPFPGSRYAILQYVPSLLNAACRKPLYVKLTNMSSLCYTKALNFVASSIHREEAVRHIFDRYSIILLLLVGLFAASAR